MSQPAVLDPPTSEHALGITATGPPPRAIWRAVRMPVVAALVVLIGAVVLGLTNNRHARGELDPAAVNPPGSRALAQLLTDRDVTVHRVKGGGPVVAGADSTSTVFLPFPNFESAASLRALQKLDDSVRLVVVSPSPEVLIELTGDVTSDVDPVEVKKRDPGCSDEAARVAGDADMGADRYTLNDARTGTLCYGRTMAVVKHRGGGPLVVIGASAPFTNDRLAARGNAALALGLLSGADDLWWVLPDPGAAAGAGEQAGLFDVLPRWVGPVLWQLTVIFVLLALWRGRRLGPVVVEPLPVVVRAAEAVEGRARLYQRGRARGRAAEELREGARHRLVPLLGLGPDPGPQAVVEAVASRSGAAPQEVGRLLYGGAPIDDAQLVHLADALDQIVRTTLDSEGRRQ